MKFYNLEKEIIKKEEFVKQYNESYFLNGKKQDNAIQSSHWIEEETVTISENEKGNITKYCVSASDYYYEVLKKENTVLYVTAYHDYEKEAKSIVKDLGYK